MSPRENNSAASTRRRPSLSFRPRPRTAAPAPVSKDFGWDTWQEPSLVKVCQDGEAPVLEEMEPFPDAVPRRRGAKSFSSLRHPVDGIVALGRRLSVSLRNKSSKQNLAVMENVHDDQDGHEQCEDHHYAHVTGRTGHKHHIASGSWDARVAPNGWPRGYSINRRPSLNSVSALHGFYAPIASIPAPIPGRGQEPPILPNSRFGGAAARAAAAAQNEQMEVARMAKAERESNKILEIRIPQDSESGIGIDLRDRSEVSDVDLPGIRRLDPIGFLPAEISAHILSYLDPDSLMTCEAVSRSWLQACSSPVWKRVFRGAYGRRPTSDTTSKVKQSSGLGKSIPNQDWKKMYLTRRALDQRWKDGKAAAIYLQGHQDSVYCSQFDEKKIITGSRDRTIRVWDAHYPWACQKIIGPPSQRVYGRGPVNSPTSQATGTPPFLTITPPFVHPDNIDEGSGPEEESVYHSASILCLRFDEEIMVTGSSDHTCIVWDIKNDYRPIHRLSGHHAGVLDVCFDDRYIVSCSKDATICVWDRKTGELLRQLVGHLGPVNAVQLRGDLIVSASGDGVAKMWNVISGQCVKEFVSKDRGLACVEFSDDGRTILTGGNDRIIYQFDANTGDLVNELRGHSGLIRSLHLDSANKRIVSGSYDMSVKVFDRDTGNLSINFPGWTTSWMLSVQSDYRRIVATSQDARAVIMDFGYGLDGIDLLEE